MNLASETVFTIMGFPITNTVFTTIIADIVIIALVFITTRYIALVPGKVQNAVEMCIEYFYNATEEIAGKRAEIIYPWVITIFVFIALSNLMGLIPGFETIRVHTASSGAEGVPLFRGAMSDLNTTLALAVVSLAATHFYAVKYTGLGTYVNRFVPYKSLSLSLTAIMMFFIFLFVGMIEVVSELIKIVSLSFRLFGNIFSGETVIATITSTFMNFAPIQIGSFSLSLKPLAYFAPFAIMMLECLVGIIQALVFAMLTMSFMATFTSDEH
jgi:F-type H+-transporting ATPase subunit a